MQYIYSVLSSSIIFFVLTIPAIQVQSLLYLYFFCKSRVITLLLQHE